VTGEDLVERGAKVGEGETCAGVTVTKAGNVGVSVPCPKASAWQLRRKTKRSSRRNRRTQVIIQPLQSSLSHIMGCWYNYVQKNDYDQQEKGWCAGVMAFLSFRIIDAKGPHLGRLLTIQRRY